jgi:hypothetical protein
MAKVTIRRKKKNSRRRNQSEGEGAEFPVGEVVDVEAVRFNKDGTIDVFIEDAEIPASVALSENRRRNRKSKAKKKTKNRRR